MHLELWFGKYNQCWLDEKTVKSNLCTLSLQNCNCKPQLHLLWELLNEYASGISIHSNGQPKYSNNLNMKVVLNKIFKVFQDSWFWKHLKIFFLHLFQKLRNPRKTWNFWHVRTFPLTQNLFFNRFSKNGCDYI
jgi:hypothetical protein